MMVLGFGRIDQHLQWSTLRNSGCANTRCVPATGTPADTRAHASGMRCGKERSPLHRSMSVAALLAAMAMVSGCAMQQRAQTSSCESNLKQIGLAMLAYTQDYDERYPVALRHNPATTWNQMLYPYVKSTGVFLCPEDASRNVPYGSSHGNFHTSYMANHQVFSSQSVTVAAVKAPASTIVVCDGGMQAGSGNPPLPGGVTATSTIKEGCWILQDPASRAGGGEPELARSNLDQNWGGPNLRHNDHTQINALYADGHVKPKDASWYHDNTPWLDPARGGQ